MRALRYRRYGSPDVLAFDPGLRRLYVSAESGVVSVFKESGTTARPLGTAFLATEAHARGLAIGLKNDLDQVGDLVSSFDFAINEQCFHYNECDLVKPFVAASKPVFGIEYDGDTSICARANAANFDTLLKSLSLDATRTACR